MAITQDKYFIEEWFNSVFRELINVEIESRPSKVWFRHMRFSARKRDGLYTPSDASWDVDDTIAWGAYDNGTIYIYDESWDVYTFDWTTLTKLTTAGQDFDNTDYLRDTLKLAYLGGGRYPNAATEYTVASYNAGTATITTNETTLTSDFIWKYVYISDWAASWLRQQRQITNIVSNNQMVLLSWFDTAPTASDTLQVFNEFKSQIRYPQLRQTADTDYLYARDTAGNDMYWYFPNSKKIISYSNRLVQLHKNNSYILVSDVLSYEVVDLTKSFPLGAEALNITSYSGYVFIFFENKIWLLTKNITDTADPDNSFIFTYEDKLWYGLFSEQSFFNDWVNLYVFGNDRRLYAIDVSIASSGDVKVNSTPQALELSWYFDLISSGEVFFNYVANKLRMVHVDSWLTTVYVYNQDINWWYLHSYTSYDSNFMYFFEKIWVDIFTCFNSTIYRLWWLTDNGTNIEQKISFEWPVNLLSEYVTLSGIKLRFWFDWEKMGGKVKVTIWGNKIDVVESDISRLKVIDDINAYVDWGTFGSMLVWDYMYGGAPWEEEAWSVYNEYIDCRMWVNRHWTHYLVEVINDTAYQLYFSFAVPDYSNTDVKTVLPINVF